MFAILAGYTISETARDSLFLGSNGRGQLAIAYVLLAGIAIVALAINAQLVRRVGRRFALIITLGAAAAGTMMFWLSPLGRQEAFALYLWTGLLGTVVVVQFWLLAGTRFTTAEAKRLYGPIAAAGAVGTLAGALLAWIAVAVVDVRHLLPMAAGFYVLAGILLLQDKDAIEPRLAGASSSLERFDAKPRPRTKRKLVEGRGYVIRLVVLTVCATSAALLADYLLKSRAATAMRADELPRFFARYMGAVSALSLILQVIGASWLVKKIGVLGMIAILPMMMLVGGAAAVMTTGSFVAIALTKGADASLRYSVSRVATELLWMPVPDAVRTTIREPLESVVTRLVQAATAGLLLLLVAVDWGGPTHVSAFLAGVTAVWVIVAAGLRPSYLTQLRRSVSKRGLTTAVELDIRAVETVVEALSSDDDQRVIAALQILTTHRRTKLIPALILRHDSPEVLAVALDAIATPERSDWRPLTQRLMLAPSPKVRMLALRALARIDDQTAIMAGLSDDDPGVLAHAVFWKLQMGDELVVIENPTIAVLLAESGARGVVARLQLLDAIRSHGDGRWTEVLVALSRTEDDGSVESLALAMAHIPDPRFLPFLIGRLVTRVGRARVREALVAIGEPALVELERALAVETTPPRLRLHLPTTIATFGSTRAAEILGTQLAREHSGAVRFRILRGLSRLAVREEIMLDAKILLGEIRLHLREHLRLLSLGIPILSDTDGSETAVLLRGLVRDKISQAFDRAFLALQALHPRENIREIERAITGGDRRARAHATEFLDTLTRSSLYASEAAREVRGLLLVIGDDLEPADRVLRANLGPPPATVPEALALLVLEADTLLAACAGYHALQFRTPELTAAVEHAAQHRALFAPLGIFHASLRGD